MFEKGMLRRCLSQRGRREQEAGEKLHNVELHDLYSTTGTGPSKMVEVLRDVTAFMRRELWR
jgi:hypothetical protein